MTEDVKNLFKEHKIIASESKSWYVGKPGTTQHSYSVTWSPGALVVYGKIGNLTLIFSGFNTYENTRNWLATCDMQQFKGVIAHEPPEDLAYFYEACRFWGSQPHYR